MKKLLSLASLIFALTINAKADSIVYPVVASVATNFFTVGKIIDNITMFTTTTNVTTFRFYDSSNTTTSYIQSAYSRYANYATNFSSISTNESGILITNSFRGVWTYPTTVTAVTNTIPAIATFVVLGGSTFAQNVNLQTMRGLVVVPDFAGIVSITYRNNP